MTKQKTWFLNIDARNASGIPQISPATEFLTLSEAVLALRERMGITNPDINYELRCQFDGSGEPDFFYRSNPHEPAIAISRSDRFYAHRSRVEGAGNPAHPDPILYQTPFGTFHSPVQDH